MSRIYPQLARDEAVVTLKELEDRLKGGSQPKSLPDGTLHPKTSFNGFGGTPVNVSRLREMHRSLKQVLDAVPEGGRDADRKFDATAGRFLVDWFETDGRGQASNPEIWPYLTILVLPDLAVRRFGPDSSGKLPKDRYLSGRRNIFYRAYLRSWILGDLLSDPDLPLYEDDLVGLVDRNLSADHRVSRIIAEQIRSLAGNENRRDLVRGGLKAIQFELRVTDLSSLDDSGVRDAVGLAFLGPRVRTH
ncbi:hypothetical protein [Brachybacterium sp.]|uniref:hypothetical protein n=1 Tax=Brachybacterium sp. TaxID=1891286 RepID=UPI002ED183B0